MASEALVTEGLTRRFGSRVAVDALDVCVEEGDVYGFLGPNGAGKTTAIRCMLGLIRRHAGKVSVFGETNMVKQRELVGAMVETPTFHGWMSARANLQRATAFAGRGNRADIDAAIERVGLTGREHEKVQTYSLGMRQRLGIARALVGKPRLLILDEPTNGLDPRGMKEVRELLRGLATQDRLTIFISSHLLGEVELLCNRVGIIEHGKLIKEGLVHELAQGMSSTSEIEVTATDAIALGRALDKIEGASISGDAEGDGVRVKLDGIDVPGLNKALVEAGVGVSALVPIIGSLEDSFLQLTSKEIT